MTPFIGVEGKKGYYSKSTNGDFRVFTVNDGKIEVQTGDEAVVTLESLISQATGENKDEVYTLTVLTDMMGDVFNNGKQVSKPLEVVVDGMSKTTIL